MKPYQAQEIFETAIVNMRGIGLALPSNINPTLQYNKRTSSFGFCKLEKGKYHIYLSEYFLAGGTVRGITNTIYAKSCANTHPFRGGLIAGCQS